MPIAMPRDVPPFPSVDVPPAPAPDGLGPLGEPQGSPATQPGGRLRPGPLLMMAATLALVVMTGLIQIARRELSGPEVVFWRGLLAVPLLLGFVRSGGLRIHNRRLFALRLLFGFGAMTSYTIAAHGLSLVDLSLVTKLTPLIIAVAAPVFLARSERAGSKVWLVLLSGFAGCVLILGPKLTLGSHYAFWALGCVACGAGAHITLRRLGRTDNARAIVFWFHSGVGELALMVILLSDESLRLPSLALWPVLAGIAASATVGQLLMTRAYALDRAPTVAAASYVAPFWALIGDIVVFGLWPDHTA
jgi:drug/metabolite transporter (DMT)-like permease